MAWCSVKAQGQLYLTFIWQVVLFLLPGCSLLSYIGLSVLYSWDMVFGAIFICTDCISHRSIPLSLLDDPPLTFLSLYLVKHFPWFNFLFRLALGPFRAFQHSSLSEPSLLLLSHSRREFFSVFASQSFGFLTKGSGPMSSSDAYVKGDWVTELHFRYRHISTVSFLGSDIEVLKAVASDVVSFRVPKD
jgi:hypothetical protein